MSPTMERPSDVLPERSGRFGSSAAEVPPPLVGAWSAVRRHWLLASLPALLLALAAVAIAFQRDPAYTAQVRLNVGRLDIGAQSIPGLVQGSQALASAYSRVIDAQPVVKPVAAKTGSTPDDVAERLSASAIPESPLLYVEAKGESAGEAVEMANLASAALIEHVTTLSRASSDGPRLLREFRAASRSFEGLVAKRRRLDAAVERSPSERNRGAAEKVRADLEAANLRTRTLSSLYQTSQQGQSATTLLQVLSPATGADSDRNSLLQRLLFLALIAGAASGVALAVVRANRP
ncbi:MAG: hypothetical protein H0V03_05435, partial [Thermoleophilaceae bacterium]|nr:hypothetical protein [Thermoleophilaceae bacterium]